MIVMRALAVHWSNAIRLSKEFRGFAREKIFNAESPKLHYGCKSPFSHLSQWLKLWPLLHVPFSNFTFETFKQLIMHAGIRSWLVLTKKRKEVGNTWLFVQQYIQRSEFMYQSRLVEQWVELRASVVVMSWWWAGGLIAEAEQVWLVRAEQQETHTYNR